MREIGSFFEYPDAECFGASPAEHNFLKGAKLFASGRDIFAFLGRILGRRKMFVPDFFCPHTAIFISKYFDIIRYKDTPNGRPVLDGLCDGSVLLAVNTFGMYSAERYGAGSIGKDVILVEDHSHAPFSRYATESNADYTIASLRKVLPLGSGAYLKSNKTFAVSEMIGECGIQDAVFFDAARKKRIYLKTGDGDKSSILKLYAEVENIVECNAMVRSIGEESKNLLFGLNIEKLQRSRAENFFLFKDIVDAELLNGNISDINSVFNPVVLLDDVGSRNALRSHLIEEKVYPPVHWNLDGVENVSPESKNLSECVLTIPLDYRYSKYDVERVAKIINNFKKI